MTSFALSGGDFGLDGSWFAFVVLLLALPFVYRATRDLSFEYNAPVLEPGGIPVELDAAARRQHETAMGPAEPSAPTLVQILPAAPAASIQAPSPAQSTNAPGDTVSGR
jgi:hypothetical protein